MCDHSQPGSRWSRLVGSNSDGCFIAPDRMPCAPISQSINWARQCGQAMRKTDGTQTAISDGERYLSAKNIKQEKSPQMLRQSCGRGNTPKCHSILLMRMLPWSHNASSM